MAVRSRRGPMRKRTLAERRMALWKAQNGLCALCGGVLDYEETVVDHDHDCCPGPVRSSCGNCDRGGLHAMCNSLLGFANDDIELLQKATEYLKRRKGLL